MTLEVVFFGINQRMKKTIIKSTNNFVIYHVFESRDANKSWSGADSLSAQILKDFLLRVGKLDGSILYQNQLTEAGLPLFFGEAALFPFFLSLQNQNTDLKMVQSI